MPYVLKPVGPLRGIIYLFLLPAVALYPSCSDQLPLQQKIFKSYQNVFSWCHLLQACMLSYKLTGAQEEASQSWRAMAWAVL